jgi:hypothetical protein
MNRTDKNMLEDLVEAISSHPEFTVAKPCYVSVYRTHQCYGGPEDGGGWHTVKGLGGGILVCNQEGAEAYLDTKQREIEDQNDLELPDRYKAMANLPDHDTAYHDEGYIPRGWSDGGTQWVAIEETLGQSDNTSDPRPHYE